MIISQWRQGSTTITTPGLWIGALKVTSAKNKTAPRCRPPAQFGALTDAFRNTLRGLSLLADHPLGPSPQWYVLGRDHGIVVGLSNSVLLICWPEIFSYSLPRSLYLSLSVEPVVYPGSPLVELFHLVKSVWTFHDGVGHEDFFESNPGHIYAVKMCIIFVTSRTCRCISL